MGSALPWLRRRGPIFWIAIGSCATREDIDMGFRWGWILLAAMVVASFTYGGEASAGGRT